MLSPSVIAYDEFLVDKPDCDAMAVACEFRAKREIDHQLAGPIAASTADVGNFERERI